ncbi:hypothetical protein LTR49_018238 [Elasticomyces elasticus]|nr:hypothetical protein LTR49_018238 [Elasticomyces elasticus]
MGVLGVGGVDGEASPGCVKRSQIRKYMARVLRQCPHVAADGWDQGWSTAHILIIRHLSPIDRRPDRSPQPGLTKTPLRISSDLILIHYDHLSRLLEIWQRVPHVLVGPIYMSMFQADLQVLDTWQLRSQTSQRVFNETPAATLTFELLATGEPRPPLHDRTANIFGRESVTPLAREAHQIAVWEEDVNGSVAEEDF